MNPGRAAPPSPGGLDDQMQPREVGGHHEEGANTHGLNVARPEHVETHEELRELLGDDAEMGTNANVSAVVQYYNEVVEHEHFHGFAVLVYDRLRVDRFLHLLLLRRTGWVRLCAATHHPSGLPWQEP